MFRHAERISWFHLFLNLFVYSPNEVHTLLQGDLVRSLYIVELYTAIPIEVSVAAPTSAVPHRHALTLA